MGVGRTLLLTAIALISPPVLGAARPSDIQGKWNCGPYTMKGQDRTIAVLEKASYGKDGSYSEISATTLSFDGGTKVTSRGKLSGSWQLIDGVIELHFKSFVVLSSDNPIYTVEMFQRSADAQMLKKNWAKNRVLEFGKKLVYKPVDSMYKEAEVTVTCIRA